MIFIKHIFAYYLLIMLCYFIFYVLTNFKKDSTFLNDIKPFKAIIWPYFLYKTIKKIINKNKNKYIQSECLCGGDCSFYDKNCYGKVSSPKTELMPNGNPVWVHRCEFHQKTPLPDNYDEVKS